MSEIVPAASPSDPHDVIARLMKAHETQDWCELKPEECRALLAYIGELQLHALEAVAKRFAT